jgi:hypothetical protein
MAYSTKKRRGRPKVLRSPHDYGNDRVQARVALFRQFRGDGGIGFETSCAGRLMLVGAFDGLEYDPQVYLSALLEYANGYWGYLGGGAKVSQFERFSRAHESGDEFTPDLRGEWFENLDRRLRDAGHAARQAVHAVSVDRHWFPDEDISWAARIINSRFVDKKLPVAGELACDSDWAMLDLLRAGATALVGVQQRRAA